MLGFVKMLERGLRKEGIAVRVISPRPYVFPRVDKNTGLWKWIGYVNKFILFPWILRLAARDTDLVHICDHSNAMYVPTVKDRPHLLTCHDVIAVRAARGLEPGWNVGLTGRIFQRLILRGIRSARKIACVSALTRDQLMQLAPETGSFSCVIENGFSEKLFPMGEQQRVPLLRALGLEGGPYFLHVGSALPRKNRDGLVRIFGEILRLRPELPHRLVLAGAPQGPDIVPAIQSLGLAGRITALGAVSSEALMALYSGAEALIYPSWSEGFGWPLIEAQACGCAVFASNRRPMTDIGQESVVYFDPADTADAARRILAQLPNLADLRNRGLENVLRFDTELMISRYISSYRQVLEEHSASRTSTQEIGQRHG